MANTYDSKTAAYPPQRKSTNKMPAMRTLGVNCCSLRGNQGRLYALTAVSEPDTITLQEIWDYQCLESIPGLAYHCTTANDFHSGGLATLIHLSHATGAEMHVERHDRWRGVLVKVQDKGLVAVVNIHVTPHMDEDVRNQMCVESGRFLRGANTAIQMLQGDVNADMRTTWLKQALGPKGPWSFLSPPYKAGAPTNAVRSHRKFSHKMTDWLLLSDTTPCDTCEWTILPGLSTHYALLLSLHYLTSVLRPTDPAHKQFQFAATTKEQMDKAAAVVFLGLYCYLWSLDPRCHDHIVVGTHQARGPKEIRCQRDLQ